MDIKIFTLIGLIFLAYEILVLIYTTEYINILEKVKTLDVLLAKDPSNGLTKRETLWVVVNIFYSIWGIFGILTDYFFLFALWFFIGWGLSHVKRVTTNDNFKWTLTKFDAEISIAFYIVLFVSVFIYG